MKKQKLPLNLNTPPTNEDLLAEIKQAFNLAINQRNLLPFLKIADKVRSADLEEAIQTGISRDYYFKLTNQFESKAVIQIYCS